MRVEVTTWYLEMLSPKQLCPVSSGNYELRIEQAKIPSPEFMRVDNPLRWVLEVINDRR